MKLTKNEKNELLNIYFDEIEEFRKKYNEYKWNKILPFNEWVEENYVKCESCGFIIGKHDFDTLETCDGYYCGSCRP